MSITAKYAVWIFAIQTLLWVSTSTTNVEKTAAQTVNLLLKYLNNWLQPNTFLFIHFLEIISSWRLSQCLLWQDKRRCQTEKKKTLKEWVQGSKQVTDSPLLNLIKNAGEALDQVWPVVAQLSNPRGLNQPSQSVLGESRPKAATPLKHFTTWHQITVC